MNARELAYEFIKNNFPGYLDNDSELDALEALKELAENIWAHAISAQRKDALIEHFQNDKGTFQKIKFYTPEFKIDSL